MQNEPSREAAALSAARRYYQDTYTGRELSQSLAALVAATSGLALACMADWGKRFREVHLDVVRGVQAQASASPVPCWQFWRHDRNPPRPVPLTVPAFDAWIAVWSDDGHLREKALRRLAGGMPNAFFGALALRRLNDWVPEVRFVACQRLPTMIERSRVDDAVEALWATLLHWQSWGRMADEHRQAMEVFLGIERVALGLKNRVVSSATGPVAALLAKFGRLPELDGWLVEIARDAVQPAVRARGPVASCSKGG